MNIFPIFFLLLEDTSYPGTAGNGIHFVPHPIITSTYGHQLAILTQGATHSEMARQQSD